MLLISQLPGQERQFAMSELVILHVTAAAMPIQARKAYKSILFYIKMLRKTAMVYGENRDDLIYLYFTMCAFIMVTLIKCTV